MTPSLRAPGEVARDLVGVAGLVSLAAGLTSLAASRELGFDAGRAASAILGEVSRTLPAAALVLAVSLLELAAGLAVARLARRAPFTSMADAVLTASVGTLLKDVVLLGLLGQVGLFRMPILAAVDLALVGALVRVRPIVASSWRPSLAALGSIPLAALVVIVWAGPILLQLASPVVPFIDVLPNHVAPAEHLRTFGVFTPLTTTQSPIYGPSRTLLGYVALLGAVTTLSTLPATLVAAAFVLPATLLIAVSAYRITAIVAGEGSRPWAFLAFALTGSFARLADDRATVLVIPFAAWAIGVAIERTRGGREAAPDVGWRLPEPVVVGLALGAAILVHPVIGALALATIGIVGLALPPRAAGFVVPAIGTAAVVAAPQAATMVGVSLPAIMLIAALVAGIAAGMVLERGAASYPAILRPLGAAVAIAIVLAVIAALVVLQPPLDALATAPGPFLEATLLLLTAWLIGAVAGVPAARSPVLVAGLIAGFGAGVATQLVPANGDSLLADAIRFELPKTLYYWIPTVAAVPAAATLAWLWRRADGTSLAAVGAFVVVAAFPIRFEPIDAFHLGEHRYSESLALDLRWAQTGFWVGYPDTREVVNGPRREIVEAVRAEITAGRIGPDTPILHVAQSFQQWVATPIGVFDGVTETDVSPDAEASIHTVGGRLLHLEALPALVSSRAYPYALLEPTGLGNAPDLARQLTEAGYTPVFSNGQGTLYRLGAAPPP